MGNKNTTDIDKDQVPIPPVLQQPMFQGKQLINSQYIVDLRVALKYAIDQFKKQGENVQIFQKEMKNVSITRGQNFQGKINQQGDIIGIGKYFEQNGQQCSVYFGQCQNGKAVGRGINLNCSLKKMQNGNKKINKQYFDAYLLQDWSSNPQNKFIGCMIKKQGSKLLFFEGEFKNKQFHKGKLILKIYDTTNFVYEGSFDGNNLHGQGRLVIPGRYEYKGNFHFQKKQGIGEEHDHIRHTYYIGQFSNDKRCGYGEMTYKNRENVKLKGFWKDGYMDSGDGVYVSANGVYLETIGDDIQLM